MPRKPQYVDVDSPARLLRTLKRAVRKRGWEWPQQLEDEYGSWLTDRSKQREAVRKLSGALVLGWDGILRLVEEQIREVDEEYRSFTFEEKEAKWVKFHLSQFYREWVDSGELDTPERVERGAGGDGGADA